MLVSWPNRETAKLPATVQPEDETTLPATEVLKNIHGEPFPAGYGFTPEDEVRLGPQDFYSYRGDVSLLPCDIMESDRFMASRWYGDFMIPCTDERLGAMAWRISRERQLLAVLRDLKTVLDRESATTARFDAKITALEAERYALKAERDGYKSILDEQEQLVCGTMPTIWCRNGVEHPRDANSDCDYCREEAMLAELSTLKAQFDAVVGQETPQQAWERAFEDGFYLGREYGMDPTAATTFEIPPYTPPLKAGKE